MLVPGTSAPEVSPWAYFRDPEGNVFEINTHQVELFRSTENA